MHVLFGVLLGLVALAQSKPGYQYAQPQQGVALVNQNFVGQSASLANQQPQQSLVESQSSSSLQQVLPPLSQSQPSTVYLPQAQSQAGGYQQSLSPINFLQFLPPASFEQNLAPIQAPLQTSVQVPIQSSLQTSIQAPIQAPNLLAPNTPEPTQFLQPVQQQLIQAPPQGAIVTKHVYVHVAPEEPLLAPQVLPPPPAPRKHYKIIFIKAPSQASQRQVIQVPAQQAPAEEKTLVYVLVDRPQQPQVVVQQPVVQQPSKPEVYFIKYKASAAAAGAAAGPSPVSSGESTSSLFSSGASAPSPQYGPPGYQKRST
ncbi:hypothetical protein HUJ04_005753 [Dendroctonus ponderosae]|uniref:DUF243 domain-containing protein n=1 Tax=Dendroctonus ponderosae TaxID=77166 RepID=A0AAR5P4V4_DENPD|nr:hypothetical protein HUJ04_005753 [Dendroctonus ponderosae]